MGDGLELAWENLQEKADGEKEIVDGCEEAIVADHAQANGDGSSSGEFSSKWSIAGFP